MKHAAIFAKFLSPQATDEERFRAGQFIMRNPEAYAESLASADFLSVAHEVLTQAGPSGSVQLLISEMLLQVSDRLKALRLAHPKVLEQLMTTLVLGEFPLRAVDEIVAEVYLVVRGVKSKEEAIAASQEILCIAITGEAAAYRR